MLYEVITTTMSVTVTAGTTPVFTALGPYCAGASPASLPGTSNNGITGTWSPSAISTATAGTTVYTFTPTAGQCAATTTMSVPRITSYNVCYTKLLRSDCNPGWICPFGALLRLSPTLLYSMFILPPIVNDTGGTVNARYQ